MNAVEALRFSLAIVSTLVSFSVIVAIIKLVRFATKLEGDIKDTANALMRNSEQVLRALDNHEDRLRETEGKVRVLWDGHERRRNQRG